MDSLPYDFKYCLDISNWNESSKLRGKETPNSDTSLMYLNTCDSGFFSQSYVSPRGIAHKGNGDRSSEKSITPDVADLSEMHMRLDFYRKLGYSSGEIYAVLHKLGVEADTNTVLGELVKHGGNPERENVPEETTDPTLVSRGGMGTRSSTSSIEESDSNNLRPIVIDGSNVAMRFVLHLL